MEINRNDHIYFFISVYKSNLNGYKKRIKFKMLIKMEIMMHYNRDRIDKIEKEEEEKRTVSLLY